MREEVLTDEEPLSLLNKPDMITGRGLQAEASDISCQPLRARRWRRNCSRRTPRKANIRRAPAWSRSEEFERGSVVPSGAVRLRQLCPGQRRRRRRKHDAKERRARSSRGGSSGERRAPLLRRWGRVKGEGLAAAQGECCWDGGHGRRMGGINGRRGKREEGRG